MTVMCLTGKADATTLNQIATQLIADEVDVIVPIATPAAQIVQTATEDNQIPVVFSAVSDPVGAGLAETMEAPGANITGTSDSLNTGGDPGSDVCGKSGYQVRRAFATASPRTPPNSRLRTQRHIWRKRA